MLRGQSRKRQNKKTVLTSLWEIIKTILISILANLIYDFLKKYIGF